MKSLSTVIVSALVMLSSSSTFAADKQFFYDFNLGMAKVSFDTASEDKNGVIVSSKLGFKFDNDFSLFLGSTGVYYKYAGDHVASSLVGPGIDYTFPFASNKLSMGVIAGLGSQINYSTLFSNFSDSIEVGSAYNGHITYQLNKNWNVELSATKYDIDDVKTDTVALSVGYSLGSSLFSQVSK